MKNVAKRIILLTCMVIVFIPAGLLKAQTAHQKQLVIIDAAHGGTDGGVIVTDKVREKELTLTIAQLLEKELSRTPGIQVLMTRTSDRTLSTDDRLKMIKSAPLDALFISLHVNSGFGKKAGGYEVYFPGFKSTPEDSGESKAILNDMAKNKHLNNSVRFAQSIQRNLENIFPRKGRGLRDAPIPILDDLTITAVVLEMGFATNKEDRKILLSEKTQQAIVQAIGRSIRDY